MKRFILTFIIVIASLSASRAQRGPLKGSGIIMTRSFDYKDFDKLNFRDLNGKIEVETGRPFSVTVDIDDNLEPLLQVMSVRGTLMVALKGNKNNIMYIEDTHIKIKVTLPEISLLEHLGNSHLTISGISGRIFRLVNDGNGNVIAKGSIDELDMSNTGNGDIDAGNLETQSAKITKRGNGDVTINVSTQLQVSASGNGDVINKGRANFQVIEKTGNGDLIKKN